MTADTIAAIATAPGRAGVAVVRVSGAEAFGIAARLTGKPVTPGRITLRRIAAAGKIIDEAVVLTFKGPHSYTGEDVVEFQGHGGSVTPRRILEACFAAGARLARRGEFTERAFLNGKLGYDAAESILDLIDAKTDRAADAALKGLSGSRQAAYRGLYDSALSLSTELEHALDVDEEELPAEFTDSMRSRLDALRSQLDAAIAGVRQGRLLREGALVVLAGPPNAGKSSLMNALLETRRAIVSATPGTTRDSIEEWLDLGGWPVRLVDTAGLRKTDDAIEAEGVERAEELIRQAQVVLELSENGEFQLTGARVIAILSKSDLRPMVKTDGALRVSATTGEGVEELKAAIVAQLETLAQAGAEDAEVSSGERALNLLMAARGELDQGGEGDDLVVIGNRARRCAETLGELVGATYSADLLDRLFSRFCVGK